MSQPRPASSARPLALVTGGSSGIGRELARQFALHGFDLVIGASSDRVEDAAEALRLNGSVVVPVKSDLATYDGVEALRKRRRVPSKEAYRLQRTPLCDQRSND